MKDRAFEAFTKSWKLIPSTGGVFDVWVNGQLIFSKASVGRHAEPGEIRNGIQQALDSVRSTEHALAVN